MSDNQTQTNTTSKFSLRTAFQKALDKYQSHLIKSAIRLIYESLKRHVENAEYKMQLSVGYRIQSIEDYDFLKSAVQDIVRGLNQIIEENVDVCVADERDAFSIKFMVTWS